MAAVSSLLLTSCGSYQYAGNSNDGIYGDNEIEEVVSSEIEYGTREENSDYYKKLFEEEAALYGEVLAEDAIFTDVDAYSSTGNYDYNNENTTYQGGNAPWGNAPDSYSINIYNNGFYGGFYPYYFGYNPWRGPSYYLYSAVPYHYGYRYYDPYLYGFGFGYGYGYGHRFGYGIGFSVHPFIYGGGGYYNPYHSYNSRQHHFRRNVAYNYGRRGASSNRNSAIRNASNLENRGRTSSYSRSIRNIRSSNDDYGITRRSTSTRTYNTRSNSDGTYSRSRSSSVNSTPRRSSRDYSRSSNTNSNRSSTARSSNSGRSSSAVRSSSSGRSSSSSSTPRSTSNRGRGNQ